MPKDYKSFCLVAAHLTKNAHRYYKEETVSDIGECKLEAAEVKVEIKEAPSLNDRTIDIDTPDITDNCKDLNKDTHIEMTKLHP